MKKIIMCSFILFLLTGCKSNIELSIDHFNKNIKKSCEVYETIVSNQFGGGEGQSHGHIEIGYCDGKLIKSYSRSQNASALSRKFVFAKKEIKELEKTQFNDIFGNSIYDSKIIEKDNKLDISLDLVIKKSDLSTNIKKIEYDFMNLLRSKMDFKSVVIEIYTYEEEIFDSKKLKIAYSMNSDYMFNFPDNEIAMEYYDILKYSGWIYGDTIEEFEAKIKKFKIDNDLN